MNQKELSRAEDGAFAKTLEAELASFTATAHYFQSFLGLFYTDGIKHLAERAGAYWLITAIASGQRKVSPIVGGYQLWELRVQEDRSAVLIARGDEGVMSLAFQRIEHTDFPLESITLLVENGVLMLSSERSKI